MGGTVRSNITFGHVWDEDFYNIVIEACALREDLAILPNGDEVRCIVDCVPIGSLISFTSHLT